MNRIAAPDREVLNVYAFIANILEILAEGILFTAGKYFDTCDVQTAFCNSERIFSTGMHAASHLTSLLEILLTRGVDLLRCYLSRFVLVLVRVCSVRVFSVHGLVCHAHFD